MQPQPQDNEPHAEEEKPSKLKWIIQKGWWLHSFGALAFGVGVMLFARQGLAYADKILVVLLISWLLMFVALRFIVGPANRRPDEWITRKGVRLVTNYIIKQLYQQMFFFLVPLYAASTTWSLFSFNWWLAPLLLFFAVLSTMDLVFDNFIMERRVLASCMYGLAMFGVLNVMLPLVFGMRHFHGLLIAAGATPVCVALLSFSVKSVLTGRGALITVTVTSAALALAWFGRQVVPPAPLSMMDGAVGHGSISTYECLPPKKKVILMSQADGLRCGSAVGEPGGVKSGIRHVWSVRGKQVGEPLIPSVVPGCDGEGQVQRSLYPGPAPSNEDVGDWACTVKTEDGQLIGKIKFELRALEDPQAVPVDAAMGDGPPLDGPPSDDANRANDATEVDAPSLDGPPMDATDAATAADDAAMPMDAPPADASTADAAVP